MSKKNSSTLTKSQINKIMKQQIKDNVNNIQEQIRELHRNGKSVDEIYEKLQNKIRPNMYRQ